MGNLYATLDNDLCAQLDLQGPRALESKGAAQRVSSSLRHTDQKKVASHWNLTPPVTPLGDLPGGGATTPLYPTTSHAEHTSDPDGSGVSGHTVGGSHVVEALQIENADLRDQLAALQEQLAQASSIPQPPPPPAPPSAPPPPPPPPPSPVLPSSLLPQASTRTGLRMALSPEERERRQENLEAQRRVQEEASARLAQAAAHQNALNAAISRRANLAQVGPLGGIESATPETEESREQREQREQMQQEAHARAMEENLARQRAELAQRVAEEALQTPHGQLMAGIRIRRGRENPV